MNDAEMINQSSYRKAFRYLRTSVQQSSLSSRFSTTTVADKDLETINQLSTSAEELLFFPSYARNVTRTRDELTVDVHGWLFNPVPAGKQSRRNRYTMLLARSIAGLPAMPEVPRSKSMPPQTETSAQGSRPSTAGSAALSDKFESLHDLPGLSGGELSEEHERYEHSDTSDAETSMVTPSRTASFPSLVGLLPDSLGFESGKLSPSKMRRQGSSDSHLAKFSRHYSDHDLINCHANLTTRISPFLSKPIVGRLVTVEILADDQRIATSDIYTGDNGHFRGTVRLPYSKVKVKDIKRLEARVVNADLSGKTEIHIVPDSGISVISDMDDTVKHTNIVAGMREAFRNAFVRDLHTLEITGVRAWYRSMENMGCKIHYVSNAPYQLWPCLATFIKIAGLPAGTFHLKQYSGFLQGMFEPAAEKKRANVEKILLDFPSRKFLLIGDSGEQDLELYAELARSGYAKQILGIFIRDVSTFSNSGMTTPTGETGEDFFTAGSGDNTVDKVPDRHSLDTVTEVLSPPVPPELPRRPKTAALIDVVSDAPNKEEKIDSRDSAPSYTQDLLAAFVPLMARPNPLSDTSHDSGRASSVISSTNTTGSPSKPGKPALKRKPTALRFSMKSEPEDEGVKTTPQKDIGIPKPSMPDLLKAAVGASPSLPRRPTLPRASSGTSSYYGEGRRMTKAQEKAQAWEARLAKARAMLPGAIKIYTWREGFDCQHHAEELIRRAQSSSVPNNK